jgi:hypothetical protein
VRSTLAWIDLLKLLFGEVGRVAVAVRMPERCPTPQGLAYRERFSISTLPGNEVYCTNASLLLLKVMLCSQLHCQKIWNCNSWPVRSNLSPRAKWDDLGTPLTSIHGGNSCSGPPSPREWPHTRLTISNDHTNSFLFPIYVNIFVGRT